MQACVTQVGVERSMDPITGLYPGQLDLGFGFVKLLERLGLAWDIQTPDKLPPRSGITAVVVDAQSVFAPGASIARL